MDNGHTTDTPRIHPVTRARVIAEAKARLARYEAENNPERDNLIHELRFAIVEAEVGL